MRLMGRRRNNGQRAAGREHTRLLPGGRVVPIHSVSSIKVRVRMGVAATG
jgi:hypothetical protein